MDMKLEITKKLEDLEKEGVLDQTIAILNLPSSNYCEKRAERILVESGLQQACKGCITQELNNRPMLEIETVKTVIDFFAERHATKFITINGRGDPFHPKLRGYNLEKITHAKQNGIQSYVFTAGNNLDGALCEALADNEVNVMMSLFGNPFIDATFFEGREYLATKKPLQDEKAIAGNFRRIIEGFKRSRYQPEEGTTRLGMNYVVSDHDLRDEGRKLSTLKESANEHKIFFVANTPFMPHPDSKKQYALEQLAHENSNFHLRHSTAVNGQCQMGAGSSATIDYDGTLLRCPYMNNTQGSGNIQELSSLELHEVLQRFAQDRTYPCVMRKHQT